LVPSISPDTIQFIKEWKEMGKSFEEIKNEIKDRTKHKEN
jgi:phage regulator Rha-like protein